MKKTLILTIVLLTCVSLNLFCDRREIVERGFGYSYVSRIMGDGTSGDVMGSRAFDNAGDNLLTIPEYNTAYDIDNTITCHGSSYTLNSSNPAFLSTKGDVNGDGMDDLIVLYRWGSDVGKYNTYLQKGDKKPIPNLGKVYDGVKDNSLLVIYNGFTGIPFYVEEGHASGYSDYIVEPGDYDGDGIDEIAVVRHSSLNRDYLDIEGNNDGFGDGSFLRILDFDPDGSATQIFAISPQNMNVANLESTDAIFQLEKGDFNGDEHDDLAIMLHFGQLFAGTDKGDLIKDNSVVVVYDIENNVKITDLTSSNSDAGYGYREIITGKFNHSTNTNSNKSNVDDLLIIRNADSDSTGDGYGDGTEIFVYDFNDTSNTPTLFWQESSCTRYSDIDNSDQAYIVKTGRFNSDEYDDIILVYRWGVDRNNDSIKDNSKYIILDGHNQTVLCSGTSQNTWQGYGIDKIFVGNFDGQNNDDVIFVRHSGNVLSSDGSHYMSSFMYMHSSNTSGALSTMRTWGFDPNTISDLNPDNTTKIILGDCGDFDGDGILDIAVVHKKDNDSNLALIKGTNANVIASFQESGNSTNYITVLDNELTDREFLRAINHSKLDAMCQAYINPNPNTDTYHNLFLRGSYANSMEEMSQLFMAFVDYFGIYKDPNKEFTKESYIYYPNYSEYSIPKPEAELNMNLTGFSAISEKDYLLPGKPDNDVSQGLEKMCSVIVTMHNQLTNSTNFFEEYFKYGSKYILSYLRYTSEDSKFIKSSNWGILFDHDRTECGLRLLGMTKDMSYMEPLFFNRIEIHIDHFGSDGIYDELSDSYGIYVDKNINSILYTCKNHPEIYDSQLVDDCIASYSDKVDKIREYYMYAAKPISPSTSRTDYPMMGETENFAGFFFKSESLATSFIAKGLSCNPSKDFSIFEPYSLLNTDFSGTTLTKPLAKEFSEHEVFVSRSEWLNSSGFYDTNARWAFFKGGRFVPDNREVYKSHQHNDLLSISLCAYGENLVVDPGGYDYYNEPTNKSLIDGAMFNNLFGYDEIDDSLRVLKYFQGTSGHNTVSIGGFEQSDILKRFNITQFNTTSNGLYSDVADTYHYAKAGYQFVNDYQKTHTRELFYLYPDSFMGTGKLYDYWIVKDYITNSGGGIYNQIWHAASDDEQPNKSLDSITKIFSSNNFKIIPASTNAPTFLAETISGVDGTTTSWNDTKILKYSQQLSSSQPARFTTIIAPFDSSDPISNCSIVKKTVWSSQDTTDVSNKLEDAAAEAYIFYYTKSSTMYKDIIIIGNSASEPKYYVNTLGTGVSEHNACKLFLFRMKRVGSAWNVEGFLSIPFPPQSYPSGAGNEAPPVEKYVLNNNYPNPFNPETTFSFSISQKSPVKLVVYNMKGQKVTTLADNEEYEAGNHEIVWRGTDSNGKKVGSGVYFYRLDVNGKNIGVKKCIMLK